MPNISPRQFAKWGPAPENSEPNDFGISKVGSAKIPGRGDGKLLGSATAEITRWPGGKTHEGSYNVSINTNDHYKGVVHSRHDTVPEAMAHVESVAAAKAGGTPYSMDSRKNLSGPPKVKRG